MSFDIEINSRVQSACARAGSRRFASSDRQSARYEPLLCLMSFRLAAWANHVE